MLKKKKIAMVMAAATVATSVAPVFAAVDGSTKDLVNVYEKVRILAGEDRFETAVEVSKFQYDSVSAPVVINKANVVILVGEEAIVDGLAAAPLANVIDGPILLTKKDVVPNSTMDEIKRIVKKGAKIYLVGGEQNISKEVENQLESEMNAEIVRLAGKDRSETSLKIAKEIIEIKQEYNETICEHFVVGGDGLADAMSISAIAAREEAPILVTPATGLTKDVKEFLKEHQFSATVIGGESKVSNQVLEDIKSNTNKSVTRIAGKDRHETNAKVIDTVTYKANNVYVAKSGYAPKNGDALLVDALTAAPLVGKTDGVIVLATDDVTNDQLDAVRTAVGEELKSNLIQVGGGVNVNIIQKLVKLLGL